MKRSELKRKLSVAMRSSNLSSKIGDSEELWCNLCMAIAFQPVCCGTWSNLFWEECFETFVSEVKSCPIGWASPKSSKVPEDIISKLKQCTFVCLNKVNGCTVDIPYDEVAKHEMEWQYQQINFSRHKTPKTMSLPKDLYDNNSLKSGVSNKSKNGYKKQDKCSGCFICNEGSGWFDNLSAVVDNNQANILDIVKNLVGQIKRQDDEINDLKRRLLKMESMNEGNSSGVQKINHNVNTTIDLEKLTIAQKPAVKSFFGGGHYDTLGKMLPTLKELYEHQDWNLLANLGFLQTYSKPSGQDGVLDILGRCELNNKVTDVADAISNQNILIKEDPNITESENLQTIGDDLHVYYTKFAKFGVSEESDVVYACQRIESPPDSEDKFIVFSMISINYFKKKAFEGIERLNLNLGGWVLKPLSENKTLVTIFMSTKTQYSQIPSPLLSKHTKVIIGMLRALQTVCNKSIERETLGSSIFNKTLGLNKSIKNEEAKDKFSIVDSNLMAEDEEEKYEIQLGDDGMIKVPVPTDIPDINLEDIKDLKEEDRALVLGTRSKLFEFIDLINTGQWKQLKTKKDTKMYVRMSERGNIWVKGETFFPFDDEQIIKYLMKVEERKNYDKFTKHAEVVAELPYRTYVAYAQLVRILVVAARDIVFASQLITSKETNTMYTPTYSFDHPNFPEKKDPVRAKIHVGGWCIMKKKGGSHVVYAVEVDPQGNLPKYLVEKTADIQVMVVAGLRDYMIKQKQLRDEGKLPPEEEPELEKHEIAKTPKHEVKKPQELLNLEKLESAPPKPIEKIEIKEESKIEERGLSAESTKSSAKGKLPEELGIDVSFCKVTEADWEDPLDEVQLPSEQEEIIRSSRQAWYELLNEINGPYKELKGKKKVEIFVRDNEPGQGQSVLGIGEIPFNIQDVSDILLDETQRKKFDDMLDTGTILNEYEHMTFVIYITFKRILILSPRDFMCYGSMVKFKNGMIVFPVKSFDRDDKPVTKKYVRASLFIGGWVLLPKGENNTLCYYYNRADMGGSIPEFVMKQGASMQAILIQKLRDYMIKKAKK